MRSSPFLYLAFGLAVIGASPSVCRADSPPLLPEGVKQTDSPIYQLTQQAKSLAKEKRYDEAARLCEQAIAVPVPPEAIKPGGLLPDNIVLDWRGEARWTLAEVRRAQGRWQEALDLYRLNRKEYPRSDGCVPSGIAYQTMMIAEGNCLEHLGRTDEAVRRYWSAATNLASTGSAFAAHRLVELYFVAGQSAALEAAIDREEKAFPANYVFLMTGETPKEPLDEGMKHQIDYHLANSFITDFRRSMRLYGAAQAHRWDLLLGELKKPLNPELEEINGQTLASEFAWAFATVAPESLPVLKAAAKQEPVDIDLLAIVWFCTPVAERNAWLNGSHPGPEMMAGDEVRSWLGYSTVPLTFPQPDPNHGLPDEFPASTEEPNF